MTWKVEKISEPTDLLITCPVCENSCIVAKDEFMQGSHGSEHYSDRPCPYCAKWSDLVKPDFKRRYEV